MSENEILIKIDQFDGPLALLLHLIQKEEILIKDLDLGMITEQYLDYLQKMQNLNFDIAGEFLLMAATLVHLKSQTAVMDNTDQNTIQFLNGEEELAITTRGELIKRLEELERYQKLGQRLWSLPKKGHEIFVKPKVDRKAIENSILTPIDLQLLTSTMIDLLRRESRKFAIIKRDRISIKEKLLRLKESLKLGETVEFTTLLNQSQNDVIDKVITFISLLELARLKKLHVYQNDANSPIYIEVKESLDSFNVETANGFEPESEIEGPMNVAPALNETSNLIQ
jgi:segregation and condensation protein A